MAVTTTIEPPKSPSDPVAVILVDHGYTCSLILPDQDAAMVRYAYGDWQWYALGETGYRRVIWTLAFPTQGALGRRKMDGPIGAAAVKRQMRVGFSRLHFVTVQRERAAQLRRRLDRLFAQNDASQVFSRSSDLSFVHHPRPYSYFSNSNHRVAAWLEELGCQRRGPAFASRWRVEPPTEAQPPLQAVRWLP